MSLQTFCRIVRPFGVASSRQFLGRHLPRQAAIQRNIFYTQQKRTSSKDELSALVLGLGLLSTSIVWVRENICSKYLFVFVWRCFSDRMRTLSERRFFRSCTLRRTLDLKENYILLFLLRERKKLAIFL